MLVALEPYPFFHSGTHSVTLRVHKWGVESHSTLCKRTFFVYVSNDKAMNTIANNIYIIISILIKFIIYTVNLREQIL